MSRTRKEKSLKRFLKLISSLTHDARIISNAHEPLAGGDSRAAAEADGVVRPPAAPGAADPAGGAAGGGWGAGELRAAKLHRGPAPRHEPDPARTRDIRKPHADLRLSSALHTQVSVTRMRHLTTFLLHQWEQWNPTKCWKDFCFS